MSNAWNAWMIEMTSTNEMAPRISGTVMNTNCRIPPAPSILAASYTVSGTPCIAASKMRVANGTLHYTLTMHSDTMAHFGSTSHGTGPIPTQPSMMLSSPLSVLKTNCQTTAITTDEMARGRKTMVRKMPMPLTFRFSRPATRRLTTMVGTTVPTVKTTVLRMAMRNSGSEVNSSLKFFSPTNFGGLNTSHC